MSGTQSMKIPEFSGEMGQDVTTFLIKVDQAVSMLENPDDEAIAAMVQTKLTKTALTWWIGEHRFQNKAIRKWTTLRPLLLTTFDRSSTILDCLKIKNKLKMKNGGDPDHFFIECKTTMLQVCDAHHIQKKYIPDEEGYCANCKKFFDTGLMELYWNGLEVKIRDMLETRPEVRSIEEIRKHALAAHRAMYKDTPRAIAEVGGSAGQNVDAVGKGKGQGKKTSRLGKKADENGEFICFGCWHRTKTHNKSSCPHKREKPAGFDPKTAQRCTVAPKQVEAVASENQNLPPPPPPPPPAAEGPETSRLDKIEKNLEKLSTFLAGAMGN